MLVVEMLEYISDMDGAGITLTEKGLAMARDILEDRKHWSDTHALMLERLNGGMVTFPHKLGRVVNRTVLGAAIDLGRSLTVKSRKQSRRKIRQANARAARERRGAAA